MSIFSKKIWLKTSVRLVGTALALAWVIERVDWSAVWAAMNGFPVWAYAVPVGVLCFNTCLQAIRLRWVLSALGERCSMGMLMDCLFRGSFVGLALPSGGNEFAKGALIATSGPGLPKTITSMACVRLLQLPTWIALLTWGWLSGVLSAAPVLEGAALVFIISATTVLCLAGWVRFSIPSWIPAHDSVEMLRKDFGRIRSNHRLVCAVTGMGAILGLLNCGVVWALLHAGKMPLSFERVLAIVPAADVLIWLPISIGGVGVRESAFAMALGPSGVPVASAVAIAITRWTGELARGAIGCMLWVLKTQAPPGVAVWGKEGGPEDE